MDRPDALPTSLLAATTRPPKTIRPRTLPLPSRNEDLISPVDGNRFWAVLVGIDSYSGNKSLQLRGACADASAMYNYLTTDLHVPPGNIQLLSTEQKQPETSALADHPQPGARYPTRDNIMNALYDLRDDPRIRKGDNILFYFAGRGSRYFALPLGVETLCPADRGCDSGSGTSVYDISDRELSILFQEICVAKGDCITVITDSCHLSGHGGAGLLKNVRYAHSLPYVTSEVLLSVSHPRKRSDESLLSPTWGWNTSSCVLLSAAFPSGGAREGPCSDQGGQHRGYFTCALLALLRHKDHSSYYALCQEMEKYMPRTRTGSRLLQTPTAIGDRRHSKPWFVSDGIPTPGQSSQSCSIVGTLPTYR